jgi:prefoldin subunit 5
MKKPFAMLAALLFIQFLFADNTHKNVDSKILKVTVYIDGAEITRTARASVNAGATDIIFGGLSPYLDKSSVSIEAKGAFTVLSITQQINHLNEQKKKAEVDELQKRKEEFAKKLEDEESMKDVYDEGVTMLEKNQLVNSQHTDLKAADLKAAMEFHQDKLTELKKTILTYERSIKKLQDTIGHIDAQLKAVNAKQDVATSDLIVTVNAKQATEGDFVLSYYVSSAGWYPTYDLRVDDISQPMKIDYRANVHQNSGEDWKDVRLVLSNGEPKSSSIVPDLKTWYLANGSGFAGAPVYSGSGQYANRIPDPRITEVKGRIYDESNQPIMYASILVEGTTIGTTTDDKGNYTLQLPYGKNYLKVNYVGYKEQKVPVFTSVINIKLIESSKELQEVMVTSNYESLSRVAGVSVMRDKVEEKINVPTEEMHNATTFSYEVELPYTIPNDGKTYTVDMKEQSATADYIYKCVPKLDKQAFLTARLTGWEDYNLLDGQANIYFEGTYMGQTLLNPSAAEDTLQISLGRDKAVTINRTKLKDFSKRSFFGDRKTATRAFEISVRNNKNQPIHILVEDQVPVSTQKEIEVDKLEYKDAAADDITGKLTWNLQIPSATEKKLGFKYAVKYPKEYHFALE